MRPLVFATALVLVLTASVYASTIDAVDYSRVQHGAEVYNANIASAPGLVKSLIGNERVQIEVYNDSAPVLSAGLETKDGAIINTVNGEIDDPTIVVEGKEEAISRILEAKKPIETFKQALNNGEISITGKTFWANLKVSTALSSTDLLNLFADMIVK